MRSKMNDVSNGAGASHWSNSAPLLYAAIVVSALLFSGCAKATYGPVGHGWPSQCRHVSQVLSERQATGQSSLPTGEPDEGIDVVGLLGSDAIDMMGALAASKLEEKLNDDQNESIESKIPFLENTISVEWALDVNDVQLQQFGELTVFLITLTTEAHVRLSVGNNDRESRSIRGSAVLAAAISLQHDGDTTTLVFDADRSELHNVHFGDDDSQNFGESVAALFTEVLESILLGTADSITLVSIEPLPLGDTGVHIAPVSLNVANDGSALEIRLATNVGSDSPPASFEPAEDQVATSIDRDLPGQMLRAYTDSIGGRRVDKEGRPGGDNYAFFEDITHHDGYLTVQYASYSKYSLCAHLVLEMDIELDIVDGLPRATVIDRRILEASRQRWLIRRKAPTLEETSAVMTAGIRSGLSKAPLTFDGDVTMTIVPDSIEISEEGLILAVKLVEGEAGGAE